MQTQDALSFSELILNASLLVQCVMLFLLALSVASWTIIFSRNNQYRIGKAKADEFEDKFWSGIDLNNLYQECMKRSDDLVGLEVIYSAGFKEFVRLVNSGPADQEVVMDGTYRQMKVACSREIELLESHLPTLATIGSISPYIGLFGTVWGIMHAFVSLAAVKNATLSMVAPPIAEALIATAMGLFAAIPAVMFYNRFTTKVEALENRYYNFIDEFSTILNRRLVTIHSQMNRQQSAQNTSSQGASSNTNNAMASNTMNNSMANSSMNNLSNLSSMNQSVGAMNSSVMSSSAMNSAAESETASNYENEGRIVSEYEEHLTSLNSPQGAALESASEMNRKRNLQPNQMMGQSANINSLQAQSMSRALHNAANNPKPEHHLAQPSGNGFAPQVSSSLSQPTYKVRQNQPGMSQPNNYNMANMAYRGVVPPQGSVGNLNQAQLPGGPASAVKPQIKDEQPLYKAGVEFDRRRPKVSNDEPHYITPNTQRRSNNSGGTV